MLPRGKPTERTLHLQSIVDAADNASFKTWTEPSPEEYAVIGKYIGIFSYIDMNLRRIVEILHIAGKMPVAIKGKISNLTMADVERVVLAGGWSEPNRIALENIREFRGMRNLLAHFAIKRIPNEDAFILMTKSANDYRREFQKEPPAGVLFTAVLDFGQLRSALPTLEGHAVWLSQATDQLEELFLSAAKAV